MWRSFFALGGISGLVVGLAMNLTPLPIAGGGKANVIRPPTPGVYRMDGEIVMNTCAFEPAPLSRFWDVTQSGGAYRLDIGGRQLEGRGLETGMLYEAVRKSNDGCLEATWEVKLTPMGKGVRGTVIWEIWKVAPGVCESEVRRPCMMKFAVQGLPSPFRPAGG